MARLGQKENSNVSSESPITLQGSVKINENFVPQNLIIDYKKPVPLNVWQIDMSKAYYFKFMINDLIDDLSLAGLDKQSLFYNANIGNFLPVDTMSLSLVSVASTSLQIGVFADLPLVTKRNIGRLKVTLLDSDNQQYERALYNWFASCVPTHTGYVKCLSEMVKEAEYIAYDNTGLKTGHYNFYVIPDGEVSVDLNYGNNDLKKINFSLAIVSEIMNGMSNNRVGL